MMMTRLPTLLLRLLLTLLGGTLACLGWLLLTPSAPVAASTQHVTNCTDSGVSGDGSLRGEILAAGANDTIQFNLDCPSASPITLGTNNNLTLTKNVAINGTGHTIVVDGNCLFSGGVCQSGGAGNVFVVNNGVTANLNALTIQHGNDGGIYTYLGSTLTVTNSTITGNKAQGGGAISNGGTLFVTNSTITGNTATAGFGGGGIYSAGTMTVTNSTITGNNATGGSGGGITNASGATTLTNTIVAGKHRQRQRPRRLRHDHERRL